MSRNDARAVSRHSQLARQLAPRPLRPAPSVTISIGLESVHPTVRLLAFSLEDRDRITDWLVSQPALRAIVDAALEEAAA